MQCSIFASLKYIPIHGASPQKSPAPKHANHQTKTQGVYTHTTEVHRTCTVQAPLCPQQFPHLQTHTCKHLWPISKPYSPQLFHVKWKVFWEPGFCSEILKRSFCSCKARGTLRMIMWTYRTKNHEKQTRIERDTTQKWWRVNLMCLFWEMWLWQGFLKMAVNKYFEAWKWWMEIENVLQIVYSGVSRVCRCMQCVSYTNDGRKLLGMDPLLYGNA